MRDSQYFSQAELEIALQKSLEGRDEKLLTANRMALQRGFTYEQKA